MQPFLCVLIAAGMTRFHHPLWRAFAICSLLLHMVYNFTYCTTPLCGPNQYLANVKSLRRDMVGAGSGSTLVANELLPTNESGSVLFVGDAAVFECERPAVYNSVFDTSILLKIVREHPHEQQWRTDPEITKRFNERKIRWVIVDWNWIKRYREPATMVFPTPSRPTSFEHLLIVAFSGR